MPLTVDMSLDDIITKNRKNNKNFQKAPNRNNKRTKGNKGAVPRQNGGIAKKQFNGKSFLSSNARNTMVHINISNLAPTVISSDLRELFAEFKLQSACVNFNENGDPRGTGEVVLSKSDADRLIPKFTGILLDGKVMKFSLINAPITVNKVGTNNFSESGRKPSKPSKGAAVNRKENTKAKKGDPRPKMSFEQLDAELDAYMTRGN